MEVPAFCSRHVLVKAAPGAMTVPSGMVTSATKIDRSPDGPALVGMGVEVAVPWEVGVRAAAWVSKAEAVCAAIVRTASKVGLGVTGVADGVEAKICVTRGRCCLVSRGIDLALGWWWVMQLLLGCNPSKPLVMIKIATIKNVTFLIHHISSILGIYTCMPRSFPASNNR